MLTLPNFQAALKSSGLKAGDTVIVHCSLMRLGPVELLQGLVGGKAILEFYLTGLRSVLGAEGTLIVPTYSGNHYVRQRQPYDRAHTKSEVSHFSEYVRQQLGAVRSMHPIVSLTGLGAGAERICGDCHFNAFGYDSPWGRLHRENAKILTLGYAIWPNGMTFIHYFENLYGVPYQYTKIYDIPVLDDGVPMYGDFTMAVRYLDLNVDEDQSYFKKELVRQGKAVVTAIGCSDLLLTSCTDVIDVGIKLFRQNRHAVLAHRPNYVRGTIPFDDMTT
jgi:aminoglycoside 3-N-acetyltransferase